MAQEASLLHEMDDMHLATWQMGNLTADVLTVTFV
jgi:hypothetical protein